MTDFNPGDGWRRTFRQEAVHRGDYLHLNFANEGVAAVYWVREEPVPALPTKPYTFNPDELDAMLLREYPWLTREVRARFVQEILALLRPVDGVTLTREEAQLAVEELRDASAGWLASEEYERAEACDALAARFEAAS